MAIHELYWAAAAAAAPIIALANQITLTDSMGVTDKFAKATGSDSPPAVRDSARRGVKAAWRAYTIGYLNLTVQATVLGFALTSLQYGTDKFPLSAVTAVEVLGLVAIGTTAWLVGLLRSLLAELGTEDEPEQE